MPGTGSFDEASVSRALDAGLDEMALDLATGRRECLVAYLRLLHRWNRVYNLSGVRDPVQMVHRHVLDSLSVLPYVQGATLLDLGSGAGLPGLVLAIARPELRCVLLDRAAKRVRFLVQCVAELGIGNADPLRARVEDLPSQRSFSTVVSRATFPIAGLWHACERLLEPDGRALAMRAREPEENLCELRARGVRCRVAELRVPGLEGVRHVIIMEPGSSSAPAASRL